MLNRHALVRPTAPRPVVLPDAGRLARARSLSVAPLGFNVFHVWGGTKPHVVNLNRVAANGDKVCDCIDHAIRRTVCKHMVAVAKHLAAR
jgi:hypothetical protein